MAFMAQLFPIRAELTDMQSHGSCGAIGSTVVLIFIFTTRSVTHSRPVPQSTVSAILFSASVVMVVAVHFVATAGRLMFQAIFRRHDPALMRKFHDDYDVMVGDSNDLQMQRVFESRQHYDDTLSKKRLSLHAAAADKPVGLIRSMSRKALAVLPKAPGLMRAASQRLEDAVTSMSRTPVGQVISGIAYSRSQFGARRKLGPERTAENYVAAASRIRRPSVDDGKTRVQEKTFIIVQGAQPGATECSHGVKVKSCGRMPSTCSSAPKVHPEVHNGVEFM